jgi:Glycosyl transferases group 1
MRLLLVKALADHRPYSRFAHALDAALRELGHDPTISDQTAQVVNGVANADALARELETTRFDAVLSFSSFFGAVTLADGASLYDALGTRFVGWQLDHPVYAPQSLARILRNRDAVYANHNHLKFVEALRLPGRGISMLAGAEPSWAPVRDHASRTHPIFVAATFNGPAQALWEQSPDSSGKRLLQGIVTRLLADREASLLAAFNDTARALGFDAKLGADPDFDDQMIAFLREPLTYVRNLDRIGAIRALADAGFPLTVCGAGWRDFLGDRRNVTFLDRRIDFRDLPTLYGDSRIVINLNAGNGACERALYAAMAGAAVVSDDSADLARQFGGPAGITFFNRAAPGDIVETIGRLLKSDGAEAQAERGRQQVLQSGLWRHRAQQLVEFLQTA